MEHEARKSLSAIFKEAAMLFSVLNEEKLRFTIFFAGNILAGAVGLFVPLVVAIYVSQRSSLSVFLQLLYDGNGFTFSAALLATSSASLMAGRLDRTESPDSQRALRLIAALLSVLLMATLILYCGIHFAYVLGSGTPPPQVFGVWMLWGQAGVQGALVFVTILYSIWLFCVEHMDRHEKYAQFFQHDRDELLEKSAGRDSAGGIQA